MDFRSRNPEIRPFHSFSELAREKVRVVRWWFGIIGICGSLTIQLYSTEKLHLYVVISPLCFNCLPFAIFPSVLNLSPQFHLVPLRTPVPREMMGAAKTIAKKMMDRIQWKFLPTWGSFSDSSFFNSLIWGVEGTWHSSQPLVQFL